MSDSGATNVVDAASDGVQNLAGAATSVLGKSGPAGALLQPGVDAMRNVWEGYFGAPIPPDGTNWNAYTHEQMYRMLWDNADVGEVGSTAAEWGRHSTELNDHAESMRQQQGAMQANWNSSAADLATNRLGSLGERTSGIGHRAGTVQQATQDAGDALSVARNTMPPPPGDPTGAALGSAVAGGAAGAVVGGVLGAAAGGIGAAPGAAIGAAVGAVAAGGGSMFVANVAASEKKAQAVHVMQQYETSLRNSSHAIAPPGAVEAAGAAPASTTSAGFSGGATGGGTPWSKLVGPDPLAGARGGAGAFGNAMMARPGALSSLAAARGAGLGNGLIGGSRRSAEEEEEQEHKSHLPTVDNKLFADNRPASNPIIGG